MSLTAAILIFISVFMHVAWNMLSKSTSPSTAFYIIMNFVGGIFWLPFFIESASSFTGLPALFYILLAGSCLFEVIYMYGLAHGYKHADISLIYPVVRALPVVMLAVITLVFGIGKPFDMLTLGGMIMIAAGCFIMPFASFRTISLRSLNTLALLFIALGAIGTTGYTLCDSQALKIAGTQYGSLSRSATLGYLFLIQMGLTLGEVPLILFDRSEREAFRKFMGKEVIYPVIAGVWPFASYRNAQFMKTEVPGVVVPDWIMDAMKNVGDKAEQRAEGIRIARKILADIRSEVRGVATSAPFGNVNTAIEVCQGF